MDAGAFRWAGDDGVLFDLDGVVTPTAAIHEHAEFLPEEHHPGGRS